MLVFSLIFLVFVVQYFFVQEMILYIVKMGFFFLICVIKIIFNSYSNMFIFQVVLDFVKVIINIYVMSKGEKKEDFVCEVYLFIVDRIL